jgi:hypothetical protein
MPLLFLDGLQISGQRADLGPRSPRSILPAKEPAPNRHLAGTMGRDVGLSIDEVDHPVRRELAAMPHSDQRQVRRRLFERRCRRTSASPIASVTGCAIRLEELFAPRRRCLPRLTRLRHALRAEQNQRQRSEPWKVDPPRHLGRSPIHANLLARACGLPTRFYPAYTKLFDEARASVEQIATGENADDFSFFDDRNSPDTFATDQLGRMVDGTIRRYGENVSGHDIFDIHLAWARRGPASASPAASKDIHDRRKRIPQVSVSHDADEAASNDDRELVDPILLHDLPGMKDRITRLDTHDRARHPFSDSNHTDCLLFGVESNCHAWSLLSRPLARATIVGERSAEGIALPCVPVVLV